MRIFHVALLVCLPLAASAAEKGFRPLFAHKDLARDFIIDTPGVWELKDGVLRGHHSGQKYNDFLRTKKHYGNFILKVQFRLKDGEGNSGVQFRSKPVPDSHEVSGYQADIGQQYWGCLYDESRRKKVLVTPTAAQLTGLDKKGWNTYVLTAQGNHITLELNGVKTVEYTETEPNIEQTGLIAFQVHSGPGIEVEFKNAVIRVLK